MDFYKALSQWCRMPESSRVFIITDRMQYETARTLANSIHGASIAMFERLDEALKSAMRLSLDDVLIVLLSFDTFVAGGANQYFSPFHAPKGIQSKYIFIRLGIGWESLLQGVSTQKSIVYDKIAEMSAWNSNSTLRVTSGGGTDITCEIDTFETCSHEVTELCRYAFLPPSETSAGVVPNSANGKIVVDVTVGQLYYYGNLLGNFGRVSAPVTMIVRNGLVADICGSPMADELKEKLFALPAACREIVELGQGLSKMEPTGLIGVDESIIDTCHFGIGDGGKCGVHLDVVISNPAISKP